MYYVYVLRNNTNELYIGYTNDLNRRIKEHKRFKPGYNLIYYEAYISEVVARRREKKLKYYGSAWRALKQRIFA
ncbi:MAG: hypothetical protein A3I89_02465 [Candidatus Harrisonbacteria bacterium RIFCSPLOWO2_02_FULL_41_11]|uniref:GIY-YIG domain-containing protein n=1 Tax=Candidatus Harrisonbacteria bacterium RIFCSPHIGHO2_02_FULL_42_16 TaxID=1798404 RepID=A0A1G1ZJ37_9BACT|nr:MAG: hypothetical protein A3B92_00180 [Candidatus Harrisonbacteria bacterium RIFCSPHIGHO2_02_FULL_42_16]OGY66528.1 MAG: hypothetical protein A3I89_02465 [Candidatus Harrisonbacteria bacterium RIFCSPLOWO2_02_FULL_41_11]